MEMERKSLDFGEKNASRRRVPDNSVETSDAVRRDSAVFGSFSGAFYTVVEHFHPPKKGPPI